MIELAFPRDAGMAYIHGQHWERGIEIHARFERDELELCLWLADIWREKHQEHEQGRMEL